MTTTTDRQDLQRALAMERALLAAAAQRAEEHPLGVLLFDAAHPHVWVHNQLHVTGPAGDIDDLIRVLEDRYGDLGHRRAIVEDEVEGARLAAEILAEVGMDAARTARIVEIVDGHDSRLEALSLEDAIVKDADKLWRYTESGVRIAHAWVGRTPAELMDYVEGKIDVWLFTAAGRALARASLDQARACAY
jgi:hypothetical protein